VRLAEFTDLVSVSCMIEAYLHDMRAKGSEIQPTPRSVGFYAGLAANYVSKAVKGVVVVADNGDSLIGFSMAGDCTLPVDSDFGRTAIGWGTYVSPLARGTRLGDALRCALRRALRELRFDTVLGGVYIGDTVAMNSVRRTGWHPYQVQGFDDIRRGD
jgi:hypothetical protein